LPILLVINCCLRAENPVSYHYLLLIYSGLVMGPQFVVDPTNRQPTFRTALIRCSASRTISGLLAVLSAWTSETHTTSQKLFKLRILPIRTSFLYTPNARNTAQSIMQEL